MITELDVLACFQSKFGGVGKREGVPTRVFGEVDSLREFDGYPAMLLKGYVRRLASRFAGFFGGFFGVLFNIVGGFFGHDAQDAF